MTLDALAAFTHRDIKAAVACVAPEEALEQARNCLREAMRADRAGRHAAAVNSALAAYYALERALVGHLRVLRRPP